MKKKRIISMFLSTVMLLGMLPAGAVEVEDNTTKTRATSGVGTTGMASELLPGLFAPPIEISYGGISNTAYCMNENLVYPTGLTYTQGTDYTDSVVKAILYHGYPANKSGLMEKHGLTADQARYYTQIVMWSLAGDGTFADTDRANAYHNELRALAKAGNVPSPSITIGTSNITMTDKGSYQESDLITTSKSTGTTGTFTFPSTSEVWSVDSNGNKKDTFNAGESFRIRASLGKTGTESIKIQTTVQDVEYRRWVPSNPAYQVLSEGKVVSRTTERTITVRFNGKASLRISKVNDIGEKLKGVKFGIFSDAALNNKIAEGTTDDSGELTFPDLTIGTTYYISELSCLSGYVENRTVYPVTIAGGAGDVLSVTNDRIKGSMTLTKTDSKTGNVLSGVKFEVKATSGFDAGKKWEVVTNGSGEASLNNLLYGDYEVREIEAATGYVLDGTVKPFRIENNGQNIRLNVTNDKIQGTLDFAKTDLATGDIVEGATIKIEGISDHNKGFVVEFVSSKGGDRFELEYGKYRITETIAPEGYVKTDEVAEFEIKTNGEVVKAELKNKRIKGILDFTKTDFSTGDVIEGATIKIEGISDHNKGFVYEFVSTKDGDRIELEYGKYRITETIAPEGYVKTEEISEFEIKNDGEVVKAELKNKRIEGILDFTKTDFATGEIVEGATITIKGISDHNKDFFYEFISSKNGDRIELEYGKYEIKETIAPEGYVKTEEISEFEIKNDGEIVKAELKNKRIQGSVRLIKIDSVNKEVLQGAKFGIYDEDMNLLYQYETDSNGEFVSDLLDYGTYYLKEIEAPKGYLLGDEVLEFSIKNDGEVIEIIAKNDKIKVLSESETLPFAGGTPTIIFMIIGAAVIVLSYKKFIKE